METLEHIANLLWETLVRVGSYPIDPAQRLYWPYLISSLVVACVAFLAWRRRRGAEGGLRGLLSFMFPPEIWRHRSTWIDVRYFLPHQMVRIWIYANLVLSLSVPLTRWTASGLAAIGAPAAARAGAPSIVLGLVYTVASIVLIDFVNYLLHYAQHKVPLLWRFHAVHHSAEVLNPLSNYREHPVDNLLYAVFLALSVGVAGGVFTHFIGAEPSAYHSLGVNALVFLFNALGYHLRHSHIWVRWPGKWAYMFGCPAHHQIHHSCLPEHRDRNMAFMFPIWDLLFGTWCLPEREPTMKFGIGDGSEPEYDGLLRIYARPFKGLFRRDRPS